MWPGVGDVGRELDMPSDDKKGEFGSLMEKSLGGTTGDPLSPPSFSYESTRIGGGILPDGLKLGLP